MAAKCVQFPQVPRDVSPNAAENVTQNAALSDGQNAPQGDCQNAAQVDGQNAPQNAPQKPQVQQPGHNAGAQDGELEVNTFLFLYVVLVSLSFRGVLLFSVGEVFSRV